MDAKWLQILAGRMSSADFAITACIIAFIFFMRYNRHEAKNKANMVVACVLGMGFLGLVAFRIIGG